MLLRVLQVKYHWSCLTLWVFHGLFPCPTPCLRAWFSSPHIIIYLIKHVYVWKPSLDRLGSFLLHLSLHPAGLTLENIYHAFSAGLPLTVTRCFLVVCPPIRSLKPPQIIPNIAAPRSQIPCMLLCQICLMFLHQCPCTPHPRHKPWAAVINLLMFGWLESMYLIALLWFSWKFCIISHKCVSFPSLMREIFHKVLEADILLFISSRIITNYCRCWISLTWNAGQRAQSSLTLNE